MEVVGIWVVAVLLMEQLYAREYRAIGYRRRQLWGFVKKVVHRG